MPTETMEVAKRAMKRYKSMAAFVDNLRNNSLSNFDISNFFNSSQTQNFTFTEPPFYTETSQYGEDVAGVLLITCGVLAALANALVLYISFKHLKSRNVLFLIITNFALIDEFKALTAIYMALTYFLSNPSAAKHQAVEGNEILFYKLLQLSLFVFYFGNICSVLNLILAVVNELLYIKLPLQYAKVVNKWRVLVAVVVIWLASLSFSLLKNLHSGGHVASSVWVMVSLDEETQGGNYTNHSETYSNKTLRRQPTSVGDTYALILTAILIACLLVVAGTYLCLYCIVRDALIYRLENTSRRDNGSTTSRGLQNFSMSQKSTKLSTTTFGSFKMPRITSMNSIGRLRNVSTRKRQCTNFTGIYMENESKDNDVHLDRPKNGSALCTVDQQTRRISMEAAPITRISAASPKKNFSWQSSRSKPEAERLSIEVEESATWSTHQKPSQARSGKSRPSVAPRSRMRRNSRLMRRHKCILVILSVCCLYLVYLSLYFSLKLFHYLHIKHGLETQKVRQRYIIQLILRSMFVLQASLNPLIFFRIKTFRLSFISFYYKLVCCKKSAPNRPSVVEFSVPLHEN